ncbi:MAG: sulfur carrier protein ThiS adenylyltransferase ThiF [Candidatus Omnitrophica bacterium]|nr:sulfur carrier protein ThiS adenylyltransferase ThiF [Candidatus Omnitrophota bacterium]
MDQPCESTGTANIFEEGLRRYLTADQLEKIQARKIGIGGAGGLGSNAAMILVRSGFKNLEILDMDRIEPSNLNRQQYFTAEVGELKTAVTGRRLRAINPDLSLTLHTTQWTESNAETFFRNCDFVVEAFDQADFKFQFVRYYQQHAPVVISGNGMAGLTEKKPMKVHKVGNIYLVGDGTTDSACGHPPMAPRVTACAATMAEIILDLTLGLPHPS